MKGYHGSFLELSSWLVHLPVISTLSSKLGFQNTLLNLFTHYNTLQYCLRQRMSSSKCLLDKENFKENLFFSLCRESEREKGEWVDALSCLKKRRSWEEEKREKNASWVDKERGEVPWLAGLQGEIDIREMSLE